MCLAALHMRILRAVGPIVLGVLAVASSIACEACGAGGEGVENDNGAVNNPSSIVQPLGGGRIEIKRSALAGQWVWRTTLATPNDDLKKLGREFDDYLAIKPMVGRVLRFRDEGKGTWTLRDVTIEGAADPVVATFQAQERTDSIVIDLDKGFSELAGDISVYEWLAPSKLPTLKILSSSIDGNKVTQEKDTVFLRRVVDLDIPAAALAKLAKFKRVRLDHAFGPYENAAGFVPRVNTSLGSFYVNPPVPDASKAPTSYVHRQDENRPIVFAMPEGTPKERADDMRTAASYWNGIMVKAGVAARVNIATLPAGTDTLLTDKNTIEFRTVFAPGATGLGINQTDALTGRILKSNIYVSSVFTDAVTSAISSRWARVQAEAGQEPGTTPPALVGRAVSDYYVDTYAHEIGHALGLRHNFAGNLASPMEGPAWSAALNTYLAADVDKNAVFTTSIMDYLPTVYATLLGAHIRLGHAPFTYDVAAIRAIYGAKNVAASEFGPYCEKEQEPTGQDPHADCLQNDMGPKTLSDFTVNDTVSNAATDLALAAKSKQDLITMVPPESGGAPQELNGIVIGMQLNELLGGFRAGAKFISGGDAAAQQKQAYGALTGEIGTLVKHVIDTKTLNAADVAALSAAFRQKLVADLTAFRVTLTTAQLDAYFTAFESSVTTTIRAAL
jgi:Met-zincin